MSAIPSGAARTFTASCDQPATLTVYLNGDPVHASALGVQKVPHTFPSATSGPHNNRRYAGSSGVNNVLLFIIIPSYIFEINLNK